VRILTDFYFSWEEDEELYTTEGTVDIRPMAQCGCPFGPGCPQDGVREVDIDEVTVSLDGAFLPRTPDTEGIFEKAEEALELAGENELLRLAEPADL